MKAKQPNITLAVLHRNIKIVLCFGRELFPRQGLLPGSRLHGRLA